VRAAITLAACAAAISGCGESAADGPALEWVGQPRVIVAPTAEPARILQGKVRNRSMSELRLQADEVTLRDAGGRRVAGSAIFLPGYVRPGEPQNRGGAPFADTEAARIGRLVTIAPGDTAPLVISWRVKDGRPVRVEHPGGTLEVPTR